MDPVFPAWSTLLPELRDYIKCHMCSSARLVLGMTCRNERGLCRREREPPLVEAIIMDGQHELLASLQLSLAAYCCVYCRHPDAPDPGGRSPCEPQARFVNTATANGHARTLEYLYKYVYWNPPCYFGLSTIYLAIEHAQWPVFDWLISTISTHRGCESGQMCFFVKKEPWLAFILFHKPHLVSRFEDYCHAMKRPAPASSSPSFREIVERGDMALVWRFIWNVVGPAMVEQYYDEKPCDIKLTGAEPPL